MQQTKTKNLKKILIYSITGGVLFLAAVVMIIVINSKPATKNADVVIRKSEITDTAKFYPVSVDGEKMEVIAMRAGDGSIRTAFNTCQVCFSSGKGYYKAQGNTLTCQNCGNQFTADQVALQKGGCNPVPIFNDERTEDADTITISHQRLSEGKSLFADWKN
ncbi:MAG: hypothetical protein BGN88_12140 [Clostridiales bacterium 43-6]|nr:MAG: hypothetical protein BGN88_12140 [Clostridiales bacterium 43-6]